jgi:hypothetical protein
VLRLGVVFGTNISNDWCDGCGSYNLIVINFVFYHFNSLGWRLQWSSFYTHTCSKTIIFKRVFHKYWAVQATLPPYSLVQTFGLSRELRTLKPVANETYPGYSKRWKRELHRTLLPPPPPPVFLFVCWKFFFFNKLETQITCARHLSDVQEECTRGLA